MFNQLYIASDHAGFESKEALKSVVSDMGLAIEDLGCYSEDSVDYPEYGKKLAEFVQGKAETGGVLICGSGIGMSITANRYQEIRAALCHNQEFAKLSRQHNDSNVLVLPGRFLSFEEQADIFKTWFKTEFEGGRHQRRVDNIELRSR